MLISRVGDWSNLDWGNRRRETVPASGGRSSAAPPPVSATATSAQRSIKHLHNGKANEPRREVGKSFRRCSGSGELIACDDLDSSSRWAASRLIYAHTRECRLAVSWVQARSATTSRSWQCQARHLKIPSKSDSPRYGGPGRRQR